MTSSVILTIIINLISFFVGQWLTEHPRYALVRISHKFDKKPFNCRPCMTFHLIWILHTVVAMALSSFVFFVAGVIWAFTVFIALYVSDSRKIDQ